MSSTPFTITSLSAALLLAAGPGHAATITTVNAPTYPNEWTHAEILDATYGATFTPDGDNFTNGTLTATRVDDDNDQLWAPGIYSFEAVAWFGDYDQSFAIIADNLLTELFDVSGTAYSTDVSGSAEELEMDLPFQLARVGDQGIQAMSNPADNIGDRDYMVTYRLDPATDAQQPDELTTTYLVLFEDLPESSAFADFDYNDLVVQVTHTVPEPGALALTVLGGLMILARRRR